MLWEIGMVHALLCLEQVWDLKWLAMQCVNIISYIELRLP